MGAAAGQAMEVIEIPAARVEVPKQALVRLLLIDDEAIRESWKGLFEDSGFYVDTASRPEEAITLLERNGGYDVVVVDISFDNSPMTGDRFITERHELMKDSVIVVITALGRDRINNLEQLEAMENVTVVEKGIEEQGTQELVRIVTDVLEERKRRVAVEARDTLPSAVEESLGVAAAATGVRANLMPVEAGVEAMHPTQIFSGSRYLLNEVQQLLVNWLRTREDPRAKSIQYAGKWYSTDELAGEIESGTQIGREHIESMLDLVKRCLNVK